ncbi:MAG: putative glycogen debranching enzyme [Verrucomicrobiales bacterium]|jgi:predicted glycogen debranching enzyme
MLDQFLETNGLGGYATGTLGGVREWPSQGLLVAAKKPPIDRYVLINGFDVFVDIDGEEIAISTNHFKGDEYEPDGRKRVIGFEPTPWPTWTYDLGKGRTLQFELLARHGTNQFVYSWRLEVAGKAVVLRVRPLLSGRPMNSTRSESSKIELKPETPTPRQFVWKLRAGSPALSMLTDGEFSEDGRWVRDLVYDNHSTEDLICPGEFTWELGPRQRAQIIASTADEMKENPRTATEVAHLANKLRNAEKTRRGLFRSELDRAADQYIVQGGDGKTLLSGFPRGTEMGARAMIAIRGICLSPGRLDVASAVLSTWRNRTATGMLPTEISEHRLNPTFSSPEPSLWYVIAAFEYYRASYRQGRKLPLEEREAIESSISQVLQAFVDRRHKEAYMDEDGLLAEANVNRRRNEEPEIVKRVNIQALWITSLWIGARISPEWVKYYDLARAEFDRAFWFEEQGYLYKSIILSPNKTIQRVQSINMEQVLAIGGLPLVCVDEGKASLIVHVLEERYAAPDDIKAAKSFPWLFGPFIEAWFRVRYREPDALEEVKSRFIDPWEAHLNTGGLNHLPENQPFVSRGAVPTNIKQASFSAIETSELLRILHLPDLQRNTQPFDDGLNRELYR